MTSQLCIALHDVAPSTWPACERLIEVLTDLGARHLTLLVVPDFHGESRIDRAPDFVRVVERRLALGDEVVLHGYRHQDSAPPPRDPYAWFLRCVLTAREGEFAALSRTAAEEWLDRGLELFGQLHWPVRGFVPPAWLASAGTRAALRNSSLCYTSTHTALVALPSGKHIAAPCLTASPRSRWRRFISRGWLEAAATLTTHSAIVRVGMHPADVQHADLMACWKKVLERLLAQREVLTKWQVLDRLVAREEQVPIAVRRDS